MSRATRTGELVLQPPADGAQALVHEAIMAGAKGQLTADEFGRPAYEGRAGRGTLSGSVVFMPPDHKERSDAARLDLATLEALCRELWSRVAGLSAAELQLLLYVSNLWMGMAEPTRGFRLSYRSYAAERGRKLARIDKQNGRERERFNASMARLRDIDVQVVIKRTRGKQRETAHTIQGRMLLAEAIGTRYQGPLPGLDGPRRADVTAWRLVPGTAWLASRALGQVGRYPAVLLTLDPHRRDFAVRLGFYLGWQATIRARSGTLAQPLSVRALLEGVREPVPADRRRLGELRARLERALELLQQQGVLTTWQWVADGANGAAWLNDAIQFLYHWGSLEGHAQYSPRAARGLRSAAVRALLPNRCER